MIAFLDIGMPHLDGYEAARESARRSASASSWSRSRASIITSPNRPSRNSSAGSSPIAASAGGRDRF
jgi:CheY-like chemotaxis protein